MTPVEFTTYKKKPKPLSKGGADPIWVRIFQLAQDDTDLQKIIDWLSDDALDRLYWLAPDDRWRLALSNEQKHRNAFKKFKDEGLHGEMGKAGVKDDRQK